jgi:hypothetical protein
MTLVRAEYVDGAGTPLDGRVCFSPVITAAHGGQVVADAVVCADVEQGQMGPVDLFPSEGHWSTDPGMAWLVQERIAGATPRHYYIWVPETGEVKQAPRRVRYQNRYHCVRADGRWRVDRLEETGYEELSGPVPAR